MKTNFGKKIFLNSVALLLLLHLSMQQIFSQTSCSTPSITYDMIAANASGGGSSSPTTWGSFTKHLAWEPSTRGSLSASATSISGHGSVPAATNVFYGSSNSTPVDLITEQVFNLYRGPITLTGKFLNLSTSTNYDESYLSIVPSGYTSANPVGRPSTSGSVGISVGGVITGKLYVYDNTTGNPVTVWNTATNVMPAVSTWYTLSVTFDVQNGSVVITDIQINGTTVSGFSAPLIINSSYYSSQTTGGGYVTHQWINSVRAVASVDDLLDDFTITTNACYNISGTVFNDANGLTDGIVNGTGINSPGGSALTAVVVDDNENIVAKTTVGAGGTYSFSNLPGGVFKLRITNRVVGALNADAPAASLPDGWIYIGENIGAGSGNDGGPNGSIAIGPTGATNVNFGIQPQSASDYTFDCNGNVKTFDMVAANIKISNQTNQSDVGINNPTNWGTVTSHFEWESFGTDGNIHGDAIDIPQHTDLTGAKAATNVFFGGVWQNASANNTANVSSDFMSRKTFSLSGSSGSITIIGRFLNKSAMIEENESYLIIEPANYVHFSPMGRYDPPGFTTKDQREGVFIGGNITTSLLIIDNMNVTTSSSTITSLSSWGGLAPAANTWYTMAVTLDVQGTNLVITNVRINGATASFTYPVVIGAVSSFPWLSNFRVGASVDDLIDDFTIAMNPCIFGTVYFDKTNDNTVNGLGIGKIGTTQLYVVLVDGSNNIVDSKPVNIDGTYSFSNVYPTGYTIRLTTTVPGAKGTPAPAVSLAPTTWINTGEHIGAGLGNDGTTDGKIAVAPSLPDRLTGSGDILTGNTSVVEVNLGISNYPLPVKLIKFTANQVNEKVQLNWVTATEINNDHFEIERSNDGVHWQKIGITPTKGNGTNLNNYEEWDFSPLPGSNIYRLKQVDIDGKFEYSNTVLVKFSNTQSVNNIIASPNPLTGSVVTLQVNAIEKPIVSKILIYDVNGRVIKTQEWVLLKGTNKTTIPDFDRLSGGTYFISLRDEQGKLLGQTKLIK